MPTTNQATNRSHVSVARLTISSTQVTMEATGSHGTEGVRNGRFIFGLVRLSTITAMATTKNAKSVPMLTISARASIGTKAPMTATTTVVPIVMGYGVRKLGCTFPTEAGISPSRQR